MIMAMPKILELVSKYGGLKKNCQRIQFKTGIFENGITRHVSPKGSASLIQQRGYFAVDKASAVSWPT